MLAIPADAASDNMTKFVRSGGKGIFMSGAGGTDYVCGRCGRLLLLAVDPHSISDIWFQCPKCSWFNGMDISLGWAEYVIKKLEERKLSLERIEQLLDEIQNLDGPVEEFFERNKDVGPVLKWLGKINLATVAAILTLLYMIYAQQQNVDAAKQGLSVARQQLTVAEKQQAPRALSPADIQRIATELHRLQGEIQIKRPPKPPSRR